MIKKCFYNTKFLFLIFFIPPCAVNSIPVQGVVIDIESNMVHFHSFSGIVP